MTPARSSHHSRASLLTALVLMLGLLFSPIGGAVYAQEAAQKEAAEKSQEAAGAEDHPEGGGWAATIAKAVNFAILIGVLAYFLKAPIVGYLRSRSETIRKDLVEAASLRAVAEQQLGEVRTRLSALPAEVDALRTRGQDELAAERVRLAEATAREKAKLLDRTQREIESQLRLARRQLTEHAAELAMSLARKRVERDITPEDQARLIDRYAAEVQA